MPSQGIIKISVPFFFFFEKGLSEQIGYLTQVATGQPHEGSTYGAEKVLN